MKNSYLIISVLLYMLPCLSLFLIVFHDKLRCTLKAVFFVCFLITAFFCYLSRHAIVKNIFQAHSRLLLNILTMAILIVCSYALTRYTFTQQLFILFILKNYSDAVDLFTSSVEFIQYSEFLDLNRFHLTFLPKTIIIVLSFPMMLFFMKKVLRPILDETEHLAFWKLIWLIPFFFFVIFHMGLGYFDLTAPSETQIYFLPYIWALCTFLSYYLMLYMVSATSKSLQLEEKLHMSQLQISMQEKQFDNLQETIASTRKSQHDMRHFLLALQGLAKKEDYEGIEAYINTYLPGLDVTPVQFACCNPAIDAVLQYYAGLAANSGIRVDLNVQIGSSIPQQDSDVCVILGNLLENAVWACQHDPRSDSYITLHMKLVNTKVLTIVITNTYSGQIRREGDTFFSSKRDGRIGIGIASVRNITEKYNGISRFEYDGSKFTVSLLLNMNLPHTNE